MSNLLSGQSEHVSSPAEFRGIPTEELKESAHERDSVIYYAVVDVTLSAKQHGLEAAYPSNAQVVAQAAFRPDVNQQWGGNYYDNRSI